MTDKPDAESGDESVGSLAEEAARLFATLAGLAREQGDGLGDGLTGLGDRVADAIHDVDEHLATGEAECRYCPVCRTVAAVRRTSPDAADHLADAARSVGRAVSAMLATANVEGRRGEGAGATGVEHIDLDDTIGAVDVDEEDG